MRSARLAYATHCPLHHPGAGTLGGARRAVRGRSIRRPIPPSAPSSAPPPAAAGGSAAGGGGGSLADCRRLGGSPPPLEPCDGVRIGSGRPAGSSPSVGATGGLRDPRDRCGRPSSASAAGAGSAAGSSAGLGLGLSCFGASAGGGGTAFGSGAAGAGAAAGAATGAGFAAGGGAAAAGAGCAAAGGAAAAAPPEAARARAVRKALVCSGSRPATILRGFTPSGPATTATAAMTLFRYATYGGRKNMRIVLGQWGRLFAKT